MQEERKLVWEPIESWHARVELYRTAVPGGWLIGFGGVICDGGLGGLTFVPDPQHTWKGGSIIKS